LWTDLPPGSNLDAAPGTTIPEAQPACSVQAHIALAGHIALADRHGKLLREGKNGVP